MVKIGFPQLHNAPGAVLAPFSVEGGHVIAVPHLHTLGFGIHEGPPAPPNPMNPHLTGGPVGVVGAIQGQLAQAEHSIGRLGVPGVQAHRLPGNTAVDPFRSIMDRLTGKA